MSSPIRSLLESLVSGEALAPEAELERWRVGGEGGVLPEVVVSPSSQEEMAQLLGVASQEGWGVLPAGLGSWLKGGGSSEVKVVVSTRRMKEIREYEPADVTFTAGAGLSLREIRNATRPNGQWLPLDPPGGFSGSLGAVVATGVRGPLGHLYGTARDHVLGLVMVSGDGRILRWGGKVVKNVAGFDLTRLTIGSWGSLGVVTSVSARLFPIPETDVTLVYSGVERETLHTVARAMALSPLPLAAVELVDPLPPAKERLSPLAGRGGHFGALVLRLLGSRVQTETIEYRIHRELSGARGKLVRLEGPESGNLHERLNGWEEDFDLVARLTRLPSKLGSLLNEVEEVAAQLSGSPLHFSAHVGAGVLRLGVPKVPDGSGSLEFWASALESLRARLEAQGGTLTLSSGPDALVREVGAWGAQGPEGEIMARLKAKFDPEKILAPGRMGL